MTEEYRVFVYGTLLAGQPNHDLLDGAVFEGDSKTQPTFHLLDLAGFPGLVANGSTTVDGDVYLVGRPQLRGLDHLERHPSFYRRSSIQLADGREALTYVLPPRYLGQWPTIKSGSWLRRNEENQQCES